MKTSELWSALHLPSDVEKLLQNCPSATIARNINDLVELSCGSAESNQLMVEYELPDGKTVPEVEVNRVRNGISANYLEPYMRRRDPDCMVIADDKPTDKARFSDRYGYPFETLRKETFDWLAGQDLALFAFHTGQEGMGSDCIAIAPKNAAFFALGLAMLQGILDPKNLPENFKPNSFIYIAPPFRHTHFDGKQVVVHSRGDKSYEMFSYNLYPGPSAKKGVYGMLIGQGEKEGWVTAHCSTVRVVTPYDNTLVIMHEGASGGGKSEMLQQPHRLPDGRLLLGENILTGERRYLEIPRTCDLEPSTDDMALCHPKLQDETKKLWLTDAENSWFVRVDHINEYGTDLELEKLTAMPPKPLLFLNIDAVPQSRAMIWEHIEDEPGKPCPNPRVILPRDIVPDIVNEPVRVDVRSLGVRTPPCTKEAPNYGILGIMHVIPPALAWLWRLVAPRGHANPSIIATKGISSEGVGSYWPFATGQRVTQANLLLEQIVNTPRVNYILTPNQHIGAWKTSFMPQWIARDYIARRGSARFKPHQIREARTPLLGWALRSMRVEGTTIPRWFLEVQTQPEVGEEAYDQGAQILYDFFQRTLKPFDNDQLSKQGHEIIACCLDGGSVEEMHDLLPTEK